MLAALLSGCTTAPPLLCPPGQQRMNSELLYFGTGKPGGGTVSAAEWQAFVDTTVTPRFPAGLSVWHARGQWRSAQGAVVAEDSHLLNIVHGGSAAEQSTFSEIVGLYKQRFQQESVLRVSSSVCASF
jgi:Protein of unknown function (DUF3574)